LDAEVAAEPMVDAKEADDSCAGNTSVH